MIEWAAASGGGSGGGEGSSSITVVAIGCTLLGVVLMAAFLFAAMSQRLPRCMTAWLFPNATPPAAPAAGLGE